MSKATLTTIKSFIRKSGSSLEILKKSSFDSMSDCCEQTEKRFFVPCVSTERFPENTLGIEGAWFVGRGRDLFSTYETENFIGYEIYNSCGTFFLAVKK